MTTPEQPEQIDRENAMTELDEAMVERVARIIDPSSWAVMDSYLGDMLRKYKGQNIGYDSDQFKHKGSLAKARAALTAILPDLREQHYAEDRLDYAAWLANAAKIKRLSTELERGKDELRLLMDAHCAGRMRGKTRFAILWGVRLIPTIPTSTATRFGSNLAHLSVMG